jgi:hypothetical protein
MRNSFFIRGSSNNRDVADQPRPGERLKIVVPG